MLKKNQDEIELILLIYLCFFFKYHKDKNKQTKQKKSNDWALKVSFNKTAIAYLTKSKLITSLTPGLIYF